VGEQSSSLKDRIAREITTALKAGERVRLGAVRMLSASVKNREVEVGHELSDDEVREVAGREVKRRTEALEAFEAAGREDLAAREREEREVLRAYGPAQITDEEVDALIEAAIAQTGASSESDMGKVMGLVMAQARGRADGRVVQSKVRARLGG
jgi:uncharacterized protein YqeY